jgi:hypothetical protein
MNSGIIASFVIGGLLLLSILFMNMNVSRSSSELTMRQMTQINVSAVSEILTYDMDKIGYDRFGKINNPITFADSNKIVFKSNIDKMGSAETVEWHFDSSTQVASSSNIDIHPLNRSVDGDKTEINVGVSSFKLTYFDKNLNPTATLDEIRHIKVEMVISSKEQLGKIGGGGEYIRSPLEKMYSPKNLHN